MPKNFAQDIVVAAEVLGHDAPMHKYAIQVTVADVRDGALSQQHAQGSVELGQGRHGVRADGLQRGDAGGAADRRLRLPSWCLEATKRPSSGAGRSRRRQWGDYTLQRNVHWFPNGEVVNFSTFVLYR